MLGIKKRPTQEELRQEALRQHEELHGQRPSCLSWSRTEAGVFCSCGSVTNRERSHIPGWTTDVVNFHCYRTGAYCGFSSSERLVEGWE